MSGRLPSGCWQRIRNFGGDTAMSYNQPGPYGGQPPQGQPGPYGQQPGP
ncbi:hypothetical protein GT040_37340, partial [Streptomyces sp. SID2119]|nr:hypothetical protein [Streptomyces sp. SID2119]